MPERIQLNLRLDGHADLLEDAKQKAGYEGKSLNQWMVDQIKLGVGRSLEETDPALDKTVERLDRFLDTWLQDEIDDKISEQMADKLDFKLENTSMLTNHLSPLLDIKLAEMLDAKLQAKLDEGLYRIENVLRLDHKHKLADLNKEINSRLDTMLDVKLAKLKEQAARLEQLLDIKLDNARESMGRLATTFNASEVTVTASYNTDKGLSQRELARRLRCCVKGLQQRRDNPQELLKWTKERDSVGWEYREGRYYALEN